MKNNISIKLLALVLSVMMVLSLAACGGGKESSAPSSKAPASSSAPAASEKKEEAKNDEDAEIEALVAERTAAKKAKDFATADKIRDDLKARGIVIEDTPQGPKWKRV